MATARLMSAPLRGLTFKMVGEGIAESCTLAKYSAFWDRQIATYWTTYVKTGSFAPAWHVMAAAGGLSYFGMYPYALEEHIEKNPGRFLRGQKGQTMLDYLASSPEHHFNRVLKSEVLLTTGH